MTCRHWHVVLFEGPAKQDVLTIPGILIVLPFILVSCNRFAGYCDIDVLQGAMSALK